MLLQYLRHMDFCKNQILLYIFKLQLEFKFLIPSLGEVRKQFYDLALNNLIGRVSGQIVEIWYHITPEKKL